MAAAAVRWCRLGLLAWLLMCWADAAQHQPTIRDPTKYHGRREAKRLPTAHEATPDGGLHTPSRSQAVVTAAAALPQAHARPVQQQRRLISAGSSHAPPASGAVVYVGGGKGGSSGLYVGDAAPPPAPDQQQSLCQALANNSVGVIVVVGAVDMAGAWQDSQEEIFIDRNLTITGVDPAAAPGPPSPLVPGAPPPLDDLALVDWGYRQGGLVLCGTCTLTLSHLALEGDRRGAGPLLDFVRADPGGVVVQHGGLRLRTACTPYQGALNYTLSTPRPARYPGPQQAQLLDTWYRGQAFPNSVLFTDVVQFAPAVAQEGSPGRYGYILVIENVTRLCGAYIPRSCIDQGQSDLCVNRAIDALGAGGGSGRLSSGAAGGLAAGVVVGVLLLIVLPAVFLLRRRARRRKGAGGGALLPATHPGGGAWLPSDRHGSQETVLEAGERLMMDARLWQLAGTSTASNALLSAVHIGGGGGHVSSSELPSGSSVAPLGEDEDAIMLGVLLGAGAYGRVYRGRWRGLAVAVKVIDCDVNTAMAVMNEVKLVTSFNHPNVVRAYYSATWVSRPPPSAVTTREGGSPAGASRHPSSVLTTTSTAGTAAVPAATSGATGASLPPPQSATDAGGTRGQLPRPPSPAGVLSLPAVAEEGHAGGSQGCVTTPTHSPPTPFAGVIQQTPLRDAAADAVSAAVQQAPAAGLPAPSPAGSQHSSSVNTGQVMQSVYALMTLPPDGELPEDLQDLEPHGVMEDGRDTGDQQQQQQQAEVGGVSVTGLSFWVQQQPTLSTAAALPSGPYQQIVSSTAPPVLHPGGAAAAVVLLGGSSSAPGGASGAGTASLSEPGSMAAGAGKASAPAGSSPSSSMRPVQPPSPPSATRGEAAAAAAAGLGEGGGTGQLGKRRGSRGGGTSREGRAQTWLVLELCSGGTLADVLGSGSSNTVDVLWLLRDAAAGVAYLHARNVVHGDLNARNVLVAYSQESPCGLTAKVGDFGLSRRLTGARSHRTTSTAGTINHTAPELLRLGKLSPAADVYAFGIMMWEAFTGDTAFSSLHIGQIFEVVVLGGARPRIPDTIPPPAAALMAACWSAQPCDRPTMVAVVGVLQRLLDHWAGTGQEQQWVQHHVAQQQQQLQQQQQQQQHHSQSGVAPASQNWQWAHEAAAVQQAAAAAGGQWVVEVVAADTRQGQRPLGPCGAAATAAAAKQGGGGQEQPPAGLAASHHIQDL